MHRIKLLHAFKYGGKVQRIVLRSSYLHPGIQLNAGLMSKATLVTVKFSRFSSGDWQPMR